MSACSKGLTFDESKEAFPTDYYALVNRNIHHVITEGESYRHLLRRITAKLNEVLREHPGKRIAIYSHTGAICFLTLHLLGAIHRRHKTNSLDHHFKLRHQPLRDYAAHATSVSWPSTTHATWSVSPETTLLPPDDLVGRRSDRPVHPILLPDL